MEGGGPLGITLISIFIMENQRCFFLLDLSSLGMCLRGDTIEPGVRSW